MNTSPTRIRLIDGLRGFSLAGILMANMLVFQYGVYGQNELQLFGVEGIDRAVYSLLKIAVVGSFMPIFAFMFGFGMIKLTESLQSRELRPKCHLSRRFLLLFGIGLLHINYVWEGDILAFYGVLGFFLLMFLNRKPKTLLIWAIMLLVVAGLSGLPGSNPMNPLANPTSQMETYIIQSQEVFGSGSYAEIKEFSNHADPIGDELNSASILLLLVFTPLMTVPMFLLGMHAARMGTFDDPQAMRQVYVRRAKLLIPVGLVLKAYSVIVQLIRGEEEWFAIGIGEAIGGSLLALGYIYAFALLYTRDSRMDLLRRFEAVGRLSLTNYLMQSVICTMIFYGYGIGLFGRAGVFVGALIALAVYGLQLWISPLYLKRFRSGPVEHILRIWTYLSWKGQPRKKKSSKQMTLDNAPGMN
ncbi:hypothetical protein ASD24_02025 [Paenibacillus sp. Root52]|uniref:DUF418 domain-containing protein n=1 Tax=Paenibacillus sp. Root52 TaxID=1736552 RepID=UPI0006F7863D|nr:DUF418 domain-containing protein [Paenibacillus sp. Root52]KQY94361.1 hypothetical protein ASD24_02025 [Paenibacillus sp. Root52]